MGVEATSQKRMQSVSNTFLQRVKAANNTDEGLSDAQYNAVFSGLEEMMALQATLLARLGAGAVSDYVSELSQLQQQVVRYTDGLHAALASLREIQTTNVAQNNFFGSTINQVGERVQPN